MRTSSLAAVAVLAAVGLCGAVATTRAQDNPLPVSVGDTITLAYPNESESRCLVGAIHGQFVRCDSRKEDVPFGFRRPPIENWYNLAAAKYVGKMIQQ